MTETAQKTRMTWSDYAALPADGKQYQVVEGELIVAPAPNVPHQEIAGQLYRQLAGFVENTDAGKILIAPVDVVLDENNIFQPDLVFIQKSRLGIVQNQVRGAPDLAIEVLSPSTAAFDRERKAETFARFGVPHFWLVSPMDETVILYRLAEGKYERVGLYQGRDTFEAEPFPDLTIDLSKIWPK